MHNRLQANNKSVGKNAVLNILKTFLSIVFPLITFPYVSRVLGVDNLGKVNYANSIVSYFALLAALGISTYSVREGARLRNDKSKLESFIKEILSINIISCIFVYTLLFITILFVNKLKMYKALIAIQSLSIIFTTIGIEWVNIIYEDYKYITIRSFFVQLISLVFLFLFVKRKDDYYIYASIIALSQGFISFINIIHVSKYCRIRVGIPRNILVHIKPIMVLFSNNIAVAIYVNSDITMLGWMTSDYCVGLYSVAVKVYTIIKQLIAAIYNVVMATMSYYVSQNDLENYKKLLNQIIGFVITLSIPATVGLFCVSEEVIVILSGAEYIQASTALKTLSIAFLFAIIGGLIANCVNLPNKRELLNLKATGVSAIINVVLNLFLIPVYKQNGAAITTLISEITVCGILVFQLNEYRALFDLWYIFEILKKSFTSSVSIAVIAILLKDVIGLTGICFLGAEIITGIVFYVIISLLLKNEIIVNLLMMVKNKKFY